MKTEHTKTKTKTKKLDDREFFLYQGLVWTLAFLIYLISSMAWAENQPKTIIVLGDSLSAGYQLPRSAAFPEQLETHLKTKNMNVSIQNAGVSGDTTAGGLARLEWVLPQDPGTKVDLVIVELGGNDVLRGLEPSRTKKNLHEIITTLKAKNIPILLAGMMSPPNMGREYEAEFNKLYPELANEHNIPLFPFFLEGVADKPELLLPDGLHPNEEGIAVIVQKITPTVLKALNLDQTP